MAKQHKGRSAANSTGKSSGNHGGNRGGSRNEKIDEPKKSSQAAGKDPHRDSKRG